MLEHIDIEVMVHIILATCVLHKFCFLHDDFHQDYCLGDDGDDDSDGVGMDGHAMALHDGLKVLAEAKQMVVNKTLTTSPCTTLKWTNS